MATNPTAPGPAHSRRRLLALGVLGGAAGLFARGSTASATSAPPLLLGTSNTSPGQTTLSSLDAEISFGDIGSGSGSAIAGWIDGNGSTSIGVHGGAGGGGGIGVHGYIDGGGGIAMVADASRAASGDALHVIGAARFSTAGLATIPKGQASVTVSPGVPITTNTKVLATLQSGGGIFQRVGRSPTSGTITLHLTAAATAPVTVAYLVLS